MEKVLSFLSQDLLNLEKSEFTFNYSVSSRKYACRNREHKYVFIFIYYFEVKRGKKVKSFLCLTN
jgi:hypothetical protein